MKYRKPGNRPFEITGEVERVGLINGVHCAYILTSKPREKRECTKLYLDEKQVMQLCPFLYETVKIQFIKGCIFINKSK